MRYITHHPDGYWVRFYKGGTYSKMGSQLQASKFFGLSLPNDKQLAMRWRDKHAHKYKKIDYTRANAWQSN